MNDPYKYFDKIRMRFSLCKKCDNFRAYCFDQNQGFYCSGGNLSDYYIPFEYPLMDKEMKIQSIMEYQKNELPNGENGEHACKWHTMCSMANFMQTASNVEKLVYSDYNVVRTPFDELDLSDEVIKHAFDKDKDLEEWGKKNPKAFAYLFMHEETIQAFVMLNVEKDVDYSWILPAPPTQYYFQPGEKRVCMRKMYSNGVIPNAQKLIIALAYKTAVDEEADEIYALSTAHTSEGFQSNGFHSVGTKLNGDGSDPNAQAYFVTVKRLKDLIDGE